VCSLESSTRALLVRDRLLDVFLCDAVVFTQVPDAFELLAAQFEVCRRSDQCGLGLHDRRVLVEADAADCLLFDRKGMGLDALDAQPVELPGL
jgi:hypothetical protein